MEPRLLVASGQVSLNGHFPCAYMLYQRLFRDFCKKSRFAEVTLQNYKALIESILLELEHPLYQLNEAGSRKARPFHHEPDY